MNTTNQKAATGTVNVTDDEAKAVEAIVAPPTDLPRPPAGWAMKKGGVRRGGLRPKAAQVAVAPALAKELSANAATYVEDFGKKAPDPNQVASAFALAAQWSGVVSNLETFRAFASEQSAYSWKTALSFGRALASGFDFAASRDAAVKERFPELAKLMASFTRGPSKPKKSKKAKGNGTSNATTKSGGEPPAATTQKVVVEGTPVAKPTA